MRDIIIMCLFAFNSLASSDRKVADYFFSTWNGRFVTLAYFPCLEFGTHKNGIGYNGELIAWLPIDKTPVGVGLKMDLNGMYYEKNFGIPGRSFLIEPSGTFSIGWGQPSTFKVSRWMRGSPYRHSVHYRFSYYLATDSTSQAYAEYHYELNLSHYRFVFVVGNDDQTFLRFDRYRSSAVDLSLYNNRTEYVIGCSIGMKLWHGDFSDQLYLTKNETYNFNGIHGGEYSLGLLYCSFTYNCFHVSLGYDSDKIRIFFQNGMHRIMNNGLTPPVNRSDRIYFNVALFGNNGHY